MGISRRKLLAGSAAGVAAAGIATLGYTFRIEPHWLKFPKHDLPIYGLPQHLAGKTLIQISDLHVGPNVSANYIEHSLRTAASLNPDIVAFTGDFVTYESDEQLAQLSNALRFIPKGTLATVASLGNHDYGHGWRQLDVADAITDVLTDAGVDVLVNGAVDADGLALVGLGELWAGQFGPAEVLGNRQASTLVLSHNPDTLDQPGWQNYSGWVLAGHTHGGQCKPPFLPPPILPVRNPLYTSGAIALQDGRAVYISPGVGYLRSVRFNVRPEIPIFTLRVADRDHAASFV